MIDDDVGADISMSCVPALALQVQVGNMGELLVLDSTVSISLI